MLSLTATELGLPTGDVDEHGDVLPPEEQLRRLHDLLAQLGPSARQCEPCSHSELHYAMFGHRFGKGCCGEAA